MIILRSIWVRLMVIVMMLAITLPMMVQADPYQGRGQGKKARRLIYDRDDYDRGRNKQGRWRGRNKRNKKAEKFINGHDARDGRWDGRGPRPDLRRLPPSRRWPR
jgi:hypothetical protein